MPMLAKEPTLWPNEDVFDEIRTAGQPWCALHVRPRTEKTVARQLRSRNVPFFLPIHESWKTYQRRRVASYSPLFPGYVFAAADRDSRAAMASVKEVVAQLQPTDCERLTDDLKRIHTLLEVGAPVTREERLEPGMPARIISGPLAGMSGTVIRNQNGLKFVLQVEFIHQYASIEVDGSLVEAE
jgi:transcriptional antiterminator RfaH